MSNVRPSSFKQAKSRSRQVIFALLAVLLLLASLELLARLLPLQRFEPKLIDQSYPIFVSGSGQDQANFVTNSYFEPYMSFQRFAKKKPAGVTRVFMLGASAALGWPSDEACSATGYLRRSLNELVPGRFEIINAATMSFGSHRVLDLLHDIVELDPDIVIVWSGNNEYVEDNVYLPGKQTRWEQSSSRFLKRSALYRTVRAGVYRFAPGLLIAKPADQDLTNLRENPRISRGSMGRLPETDKRILENYQRNLRQMLDLLASRGVKPVVCTVPVNLAGWAPEVSPPRFGSTAQANRWKTAMDQGINSLNSPRAGKAVEAFQEALKIAPEYALTPFFLGWALQKNGDLEHAYSMLQKARDKDLRVIRALGTFNDFIRKLPQDRPGTTVIDLEEIFRRASGNQLVGMDLFYDYCHPNPDGHRLIAEALLPVLTRLSTPSFNIPPGSTIAATCPTPDPRRQAAISYALGMTYGNNGNNRKAEAAYRDVIRLNPGFTEAYSNLALLLMKRGEMLEAETLILRAIEVGPDNLGALFQLASIRLWQGRLNDAEQLLRKILKLNQNFSGAQEILGDIAARRDQWQPAQEAYSKALQQGGDNPTLRRKLGQVLYQQGRTQEAIQHWQQALLMNPDDRQILELIDSAASGRPAGTQRRSQSGAN